MDECPEPSVFPSIESRESPSHASGRRSLEFGKAELTPEESRAMFISMCKDYEKLRIRAHNANLTEEEFMELSAVCQSDNPGFFTEVHELWTEDYNRAQMHQVDPFQKSLELLRSHLNPIVPEDFEKRKKLRRSILGPLKSPAVVFGVSPFELPPSLKLEKTSLKKQQAASEACRIEVPQKSSDSSNSKSPRKLEGEGLWKLGSPQTRKLSSPRWDGVGTNGSPRGPGSKSPRDRVQSFFGFRKPGTQEEETKKNL